MSHEVSGIGDRLNKLPSKVSMPFNELLSGGLISEGVVSDVLDASELAGDHTKSIGFAVAYQHMKSMGIPVMDVVRMAKSQNRRIRLNWSPKRWKYEHERLSRAEALSKLAEENINYNIGEWVRLLPKRFPGYVIKNSRRLGMEGLRQRHCVASYHTQLMNGSSAIASVFIDKERWTVQLFKTNNQASPLRIGQVRSKLNRIPTPEITRRIHDVLNIEEFIYEASSRYQRAEEARSYTDNLRLVLPVLRELHAEEVEVYFDGSGDSGCIEDISIVPKELSLDGMVDTIRVVNKLVDDNWVRREERNRASLSDAIEEITYEFLEESGTNWHDNEGGFGYLKIDVAEGTVSLSVDTRYTQSETEYANKIDIVSGEEVN